LREEALRTMVSMAGGTWSVVEELLTTQAISSIDYRNERYFLYQFKKLPERSNKLPL